MRLERANCIPCSYVHRHIQALGPAKGNANENSNFTNYKYKKLMNFKDFSY